MFYKLGVKQLLKNKRVLALSVIAIGLGVGILYTINIAADTVQTAIEHRADILFGNVDYTVYRNGIKYYDNTSYGIPYSYMNTIRSIPGVEHVVARACSITGYFAPDDTTTYGNDVNGIDIHNADESIIGVANVTGYLPAIGTGDKTLEQLLNYTGVLRPVVISDGISTRKGIVIGDTIRILPANATKLYANSTEIAAAITKEQKIALENKIRGNASRILQFTVVGIIIDGSEGPLRPMAKNEQSLDGLVPSPEAIYMRMNDTLAYVHNQNYNNITKTGEVGFFLVDTSSSFSGSASTFSSTTSSALGTASIIGNDIRQAFQGYIDYAVAMARVILSVMTVAAWISCCVLIKTTTQMNLDEKMREIGVLRAVGFKKKAISEIVMGQLSVVMVIGTAVGLAIGLVPPQFFDTSKITQFLSYNKFYEMDPVTITISLLSTAISLISGFTIPLVSGLAPLIGARKLSIVEMISPSYMRYKAEKNKKRGMSKR